MRVMNLQEFGDRVRTGSQSRKAEEAVPGPSVFPSGEPGVSGDFWVNVTGSSLGLSGAGVEAC